MGERAMGRPPIGKQAMSATERQRRWRAKRQASKPVRKPAERICELEAAYAALLTTMKDRHAALQSIIDRLDQDAACKRKALLNQKHADTRQLERKLKGVTGYGAVCDIVWGPAQGPETTPAAAGARKQV